MKYIENVKEFMTVMGQDIPASPCIPPDNIVQLRKSLIAEELKELTEATDNKDIVEIADALCDIRYVVEGAMLAYGFSPELMDELFAEVQRSNMSKACKTKEEAINTCEHYMFQNYEVPVTYTRVGDYWIVARLDNGKVLKSINWSEPDLKSILLKHGVQC